MRFSGSDTMSVEFVVPDVSVPFPAAPIRKDAEALCARSIAWAEDVGLIGKRGAARLAGSPLLGLGVALTGPAPWNGATVLMDWFLWALVLDDRIDDGPWAERGTLDRFTESVRVVVDGGSSADLRDPMLAVLADDLWPRTRALGDTAWLGRLRDHLMRHLDAQRVFVRTREATDRIQLHTYATLRRDAFGAHVFFDLIEAVDYTAHSSGDPCETDCRLALRDHAADIVAWTNDICSVEKDVVHGEQHNLVLILHEEQGRTWQNAMDAAHAMVTEAVRQFDRVKRRHLAHQRDGARRAAMSYVERLEQVVRASVDWHQSVSRYRLRPVSTDTRRTVDIALTPPTLKSREFEADPYPLYQRLRRTLPVVYDETTDAWLLSRHVDVRAALTNPGFSTENYAWQIAPLLGHSIVSMDGREHTTHRALLTPSFRSNALAAMHDSIAEVVTELVEDLRGRTTADLIPEFCNALPIKVMARVLGLPVTTAQDVDRLKDWCEVGFSYMGNYRQEPGLLARGLANRDDFFAYLEPHIAARRRDSGLDLISAMQAATLDGAALSEDYIRGCCAVLLTAGSETTQAAIANLLANLLDLPEVMTAVRREPTLMDRALAETLRRNPPLHVVLRQSREAVDLPSGAVPANATVACLIGSANRDPERFSEPDVFSLDRTDGSADRDFGGAAGHLAFGAGRHFCLGSHLARTEITVGVNTLLAAFPDLRWAPGFRPVETGFLTRKPAHLRVTL